MTVCGHGDWRGNKHSEIICTNVKIRNSNLNYWNLNVKNKNPRVWKPGATGNTRLPGAPARDAKGR
jgi:hypothetical protein